MLLCGYVWGDVFVLLIDLVLDLCSFKVNPNLFLFSFFIRILS